MFVHWIDKDKIGLRDRIDPIRDYLKTENSMKSKKYSIVISVGIGFALLIGLTTGIGVYIGNRLAQDRQFAQLPPMELKAGTAARTKSLSMATGLIDNNVEALKKELTATQRDVETDLIHLRDVDLAHLISLGGWIRALEVSSHAVEKKYTVARARLLYREDIADYYEGSIEALDPRVSDRDDLRQIRMIISDLRTTMLLSADAEPTEKGVQEIAAAARKLASLALQRP